MSSLSVVTAEGVTVEDGDYVVGGSAGTDDLDYGRAFERDGELWVAWAGGACQTPIGDGIRLDVYTSEAAARAAASSRMDG